MYGRLNHLAERIRETDAHLTEILPSDVLVWLKETCKEIQRCEARDNCRRLARKFEHLQFRSHKLSPPVPNMRMRNIERKTPPTTSGDKEIENETKTNPGRPRVNILTEQLLPPATLSLLEKGPQFALMQRITASTLRAVELGIERLAYGIRCAKHKANEMPAAAPAKESLNPDTDDHPDLRLVPPFNDLSKRQPNVSDEETERTLARLKKDIMTVFNNHAGKKMKPNTTAGERRALKELKTNTDLIVKPSDKCKGFVIMDRRTYVDKARLILDDPEAYEKLKRDPTKHVEKEMTQLWRRTTDKKTTIPQRLLHALVPRHSRCAEWYGLPKDHKPLIPLRPIVSACDTPCERVSWLLERILHQLLWFVPAHLFY